MGRVTEARKKNKGEVVEKGREAEVGKGRKK